jgi:hypothetical protein
MVSLRASLPALRLAARFPTSLPPTRFPAPAASAGLVRRSFALTWPAFNAPPSREHFGAEAEIRAKLVDRLEAEECDVEDTSGASSRESRGRMTEPMG